MEHEYERGAPSILLELPPVLRLGDAPSPTNTLRSAPAPVGLLLLRRLSSDPTSNLVLKIDRYCAARLQRHRSS